MSPKSELPKHNYESEKGGDRIIAQNTGGWSGVIMLLKLLPNPTSVAPQKGGIMKKLALAVIMLMAVVPVSALAQTVDWDSFEGTYRMAGSGSCIHSQNGYYDKAANDWITAKPGVVYAGTTVLEGVFYFDNISDTTYPDRKTGIFSQTLHATVTPPPPVFPPDKNAPVVAGGIRVFKANNAPLTYKIVDGEITVYAGGIQLKGSISSDLGSMTLVSADNVQGPSAEPFWWTICNTARTLIRIGD
jgi:hypothetical protein